MFRVLARADGDAGATAFDVLIALGTHPPMSEEAINQRLGITRAGAGRALRRHARSSTTPGTIPRAGLDRGDRRGRGRADLRRPHARARRRHHQQAGARVRPAADRRADLPARGGRVLRAATSTCSRGSPAARSSTCSTGWARSSPTRRSSAPSTRRCARWSTRRRRWSRSSASASAWSSRASELAGPLPRRARGGLGGGRGALEPDPRRLQGPRRTTACCRARPPMYDELWVGGKCAYKLEPVVADGGELDHLRPAHPRDLGGARRADSPDRLPRARLLPEAAGDASRTCPRGVLAHSTHVKGIGTLRGRRRDAAHHGHAGDRDPRGRVPRGQPRLPRPARRSTPPTGRDREDEGLLLRPQGGRDAIPPEERPVHRTRRLKEQHRT